MNDPSWIPSAIVAWLLIALLLGGVYALANLIGYWRSTPAGRAHADGVAPAREWRE